MKDNAIRSNSRNALGRGISALIPTAAPERHSAFDCPLDRIRSRHDQPRQDFDDEALAELAQSIEADGVLQPALVRRDGSDYVLIAGERRWRAARIAGLTTMPVVVKDVTDSDAFVLALVENLQREDLKPLEVADACRRLIEEYGLTQEEVAQRIGKSRSAVANTLRLLKLTESSQSALARGDLTEGHARQLVGLSPEVQGEVVQEVVGESLSVRETEARVRQRKASPATPRPAPPAATPDPELVRLEERLQRALGTRVRVIDRGGSGQIEIAWNGYEVLEGIVEQLLERT